MEPACSSKIFDSMSNSTLCHKAEDLNLNNEHYENLRMQVGHVARVGKVGKAYTISSCKTWREEAAWEKIDVVVKIILKMLKRV
jgi:hypothetical protein